MYTVEIVSAGVKKKTKIDKLFIYNGPFCFYHVKDADGFPKSIGRFDEIEEIETISDLSIRNTETISEGTSTTTAATGNLVKRAVVGGVLTGVGGAVIGGVTGTKKTETITKSKSLEKIEYLVQLKVKFVDGQILIVNVNDPEITELLFSHIGVKTIQDEKLEKLKNLSLKEMQKEKVHTENLFLDNKITEEAQLRAIAKLAHKKPFDHKIVIWVTFISAFVLSIIFNIFNLMVDPELTFALLSFIFKTVLYLIIFMIPIFMVVALIVNGQKSAYEKNMKDEIFNQRQLIKAEMREKKY